MRFSRWSAICTLVLGLATSRALAEPTIEVRVVDHKSRPADGKVTLKGPKTLSCNTVAARCTLTGPEGTYTVTIAPRRGEAPKPSKVKVPSKGTAKVTITLLEGAADGQEDKRAVTPSDDEHDKVRKNPPGRDLAKGKTERMTGRVIDGRSRPADAVIVFYDKKGKVVGHVNSVAARFSLRDIDVGSYSAKVYSRRGGPPTKQAINIAKDRGQVVIKVK